MVGYFFAAKRRANSIGLLLIAACALIAAYASVALSGTKTGTALSLIVTIGPALLYAALTAPLAFPFGLYALLTPFDSILSLPQFGTLTRLLGLATGAAMLFFMLRTRRFGEPHPNLVYWLLLYLWMGASMFWAIDSQTSLELLPTAVQLLVLYIVVSMFRLDVRGLRVAVGAVVAGGILGAIYGAYLYHSGAAALQDRLWLRTDTSQLNPDHFAAALVTPISLAVVAAFWSRNLFVRAGAYMGVLVMLYAVVLTGSRGAELALVVLLVYLMIRDRHRVQLAIVTVLAAVLAFAGTGGGIVARWGSAALNGGAGRTDIWKVGWIAFKQNWLFGAGYDNFPFAYDRAFIQTFQPFYANWHRASHDILLGTAVELGVVGLTLLVLAWWGQFRMLAPIGEDDVRYPLRLALEGALIALFVCGLFADIMAEKYVWLAFMIVALTANATAATRTKAYV
jgi:exopolysaccharide production protein ExoQ